MASNCLPIASDGRPQVSFEIYLNSTCGLDGTPCHGRKLPTASISSRQIQPPSWHANCPPSLHAGEDPHDPDSASAINTPDVAMAGVARHIDRFISQVWGTSRAECA